MLDTSVPEKLTKHKLLLQIKALRKDREKDRKHIAQLEEILGELFYCGIDAGQEKYDRYYDRKYQELF